MRVRFVGEGHESEPSCGSVSEMQCLDDIYPDRRMHVVGIAVATDELGNLYLTGDDLVVRVEGEIPRPICGVLLSEGHVDGVEVPVAFWELLSPIQDGFEIALWWYGSLNGQGGKIVSFWMDEVDEVRLPHSDTW